MPVSRNMPKLNQKPKPIVCSQYLPFSLSARPCNLRLLLLRLPFAKAAALGAAPPLCSSDTVITTTAASSYSFIVFFPVHCCMTFVDGDFQACVVLRSTGTVVCIPGSLCP